MVFLCFFKGRGAGCGGGKTMMDLGNQFLREVVRMWCGCGVGRDEFSKFCNMNQTVSFHAKNMQFFSVANFHYLPSNRLFPVLFSQSSSCRSDVTYWANFTGNKSYKLNVEGDACVGEVIAHR